MTEGCGACGRGGGERVLTLTLKIFLHTSCGDEITNRRERMQLRKFSNIIGCASALPRPVVKRSVPSSNELAPLWRSSASSAGCAP